MNISIFGKEFSDNPYEKYLQEDKLDIMVSTALAGIKSFGHEYKGILIGGLVIAPILATPINQGITPKSFMVNAAGTAIGIGYLKRSKRRTNSQ